MQTLEKVAYKSLKDNRSEIDKIIMEIRRTMTIHEHETLRREHFLNRGFVIK